MEKSIVVQSGMQEYTYELAGFGPRLGARIIDVVIIFIPNSIIPILPGWLYWALQQSGSSQATVGQKALKIKVVSVHGYKVSFGQASGRFFGNFLNIFTFFIGYLMFFFNDKNQCLHDYISGTAVVNAEPIDAMVNDITSHLIEEY